jgi:hypothetical protein
MADFYLDVPRNSVRENLEWRVKVRAKAQKDAGLRRAIMAACKYDILYWLNAWCYIIEPRTRFDEKGHEKAKVFPFLTWEHQNFWFPKVREALGKRNVVVEKCRGEGWTWFECLAALQDFLFSENTMVGLVSSTEAKSDSQSLGSILGKVDWELTKLPTWMTGIKGRDRNNTGDWYRNASDHALMNVRLGNQITAFAAGPDVGRGDRFTWFGLDEHASDEWKMEGNDEKVLEALGGTTDSILSISTPKGAYGAFHRLVHAPSSDLKVTIDWRDNPSKNHGLYKLVNDRPVAVDPINNPLQKDYDPPTKEISELLSRLRKRGYDLDSKTRSPWLDRECDRGTSNPQNVAQEIERDYGGSVARIFGNHCVEVAESSVRPPDIYGRLSVYDDLTYSFDRMDNGEFHLWCQLDIHDRPPKHNYIVCADLASGDGGDYCNNSAIIVIDLVTGEQVLEFVTKTVKPPDMADRAIAICKWFWNAYLAWEHMGPGASFTTQVIERGYSNCYERETKDKFTRKRTKKLGFDNRGQAREYLFADLERQIRTGDLLIRSKYLAEELTQYIREGKHIRHVSVKNDDTSHGDRVIAIGVGVQAMKSRPLPKLEGKTVGSYGDPEPGTLAYREWLFNQQQSSDDDWDDRSTADLRTNGRDKYAFN